MNVKIALSFAVKYYFSTCLVQTGRVDILLRIFEKIAKKLKLKSQGPKKEHFFNVFRVIYQKLCFFVSVASFLTFLHFFKNASLSIDPSGNFVYKEILCSSYFFGRTLPMMFSWSMFSWSLDINLIFTKLVDKYHWMIY